MKAYTRGGVAVLLLAKYETTPLMPQVTRPSPGYFSCFCSPLNKSHITNIMCNHYMRKNLEKTNAFRSPLIYMNG